MKAPSKEKFESVLSCIFVMSAPVRMLSEPDHDFIEVFNFQLILGFSRARNDIICEARRPSLR